MVIVLAVLSGSSRRADDREAVVVQQGLKLLGEGEASAPQMSAESSTIKVTLSSVCCCDRPVLR